MKIFSPRKNFTIENLKKIRWFGCFDFNGWKSLIFGLFKPNQYQNHIFRTKMCKKSITLLGVCWIFSSHWRFEKKFQKWFPNYTINPTLLFFKNFDTETGTKVDTDLDPGFYTINCTTYGRCLKEHSKRNICSKILLWVPIWF